MKYKAETWDKMQDIMEKFNDHMTHCYYQFDRNLEETTLKKAFQIIIDKVPILKTRYKNGIFIAGWCDMKIEYRFDDYYQFRHTDGDLLEEADRFLVQKLDKKRGPQFKILHLRKQSKDALAIIINHQIMDGGDLVIFYSKLSDIYTDLINGGDGESIKIKTGDRSGKQVFKAFSEEEVKKINSMVSYSKGQKSKITFDYEDADKKDWYPKINKMMINSDDFAKLKANSKAMGVTLNDVILASFFRTCHKMIKIGEDETLGIPNMVNLRRYIPDGQSEGFCNLTSMCVANIGKDIGKTIFDTAVKCSINMTELKKNYPGLHGISLLDTVYKFSNVIGRFLISNFFKNPLIGISNIGVCDDKKLNFNGAVMEYCYMTGSIKYPPYMQVALLTFKNAITFTIANYGTDKDHQMHQEILTNMKRELLAFKSAEITPELKEKTWSGIK